MADIPRFPGLIESYSNRMIPKFLFITSTGNVTVAGIDQPTGELVKSDGEPNLLVVKILGHSYWTGRGAQGYAPGEYQLYWMVKRISKNTYKCVDLGSVPLRAATATARAFNLTRETEDDNRT